MVLRKEFIIINTKICAWCGEEKSLDEFYFQKRYSKKQGNYIYYNPECKKCTLNNSYNWIKNNKEKRYILQDRSNKRRKAIIDKARQKNREDGIYLKWQQNNPDKIREYREDRKHKTHKISKKEWELCKAYFNYECAYCGLLISEHYRTYRGVTKLGDFHKEHVDDEGANDLSNCVPSCKACNSSKRTFDFEEWYKKQEFFTNERFIKIIKWLKEDYKNIN